MTPTHTIHIDNLKCGGCANTIQHGLAKIADVAEIVVSPEASTVSFQAPDYRLPAIKQSLRSMGYPETGTVEGLASGIATAKSYVSCAIGKLG